MKLALLSGNETEKDSDVMVNDLRVVQLRLMWKRIRQRQLELRTRATFMFKELKNEHVEEKGEGTPFTQRDAVLALFGKLGPSERLQAWDYVSYKCRMVHL